VLPLIDESKFRHFYHERFGRPNKPVKLVVGVLILKDMFDLCRLRRPLTPTLSLHGLGERETIR